MNQTRTARSGPRASPTALPATAATIVPMPKASVGSHRSRHRSVSFSARARTNGASTRARIVSPRRWCAPLRAMTSYHSRDLERAPEPDRENEQKQARQVRAELIREPRAVAVVAPRSLLAWSTMLNSSGCASAPATVATRSTGPASRPQIAGNTRARSTEATCQSSHRDGIAAACSVAAKVVDSSAEACSSAGAEGAARG